MYIGTIFRSDLLPLSYHAKDLNNETYNDEEDIFVDR